MISETFDLLLVLEEVSVDLQSQWYASSGDNECLYKISWHAIQQIFQPGPDLVNRPLVPKPNQTVTISRMCSRCVLSNLYWLPDPFCTCTKSAPVIQRRLPQMRLLKITCESSNQDNKMAFNFVFSNNIYGRYWEFLKTKLRNLQFNEQRIKLLVTLLQDHFWTCVE